MEGTGVREETVSLEEEARVRALNREGQVHNNSDMVESSWAKQRAAGEGTRLEPYK